MITLPESLPLPSMSYSLNSTNNVLRSNMETGRIRQRRRSTSNQNRANVVWELSDEEYELLNGFIAYALDGGNSWFEVKLLSGNGVVTHQARIVKGTYKSNYQDHMYWKVTVVLDLKYINLPDSDIFELYKEVADEISYEDLVFVITNFEPLLEDLGEV